MVSPQVLMSVADYLEQEKTSEAKHDYVGGVIYALPGSSIRHNRIVGRLYQQLLTATHEPCEIYFESVKLHPTPDSFYYPDLMVSCEPPADSHVISSACLIVEVLSPATEARDKLEKWAAYKQMSSLQHYLLVHQDKPWIEHFQRDAANQWQLSHHYDGEIALKCPQMSLMLTDVYAGVLAVG